MKAAIEKKSLGNPRVTFSRLGYHIGERGSFEKRTSGAEFPRFHIYLKDIDDTFVEISIHLDTRPHSYSGFSAHVGEYDSEVVKKELQRVLESLS